MALLCPLQNVSLMIIEEFALRTGVHMPWPQLERLADEIARSVERKVHFTHKHFFTERERSSADRDLDIEIDALMDALADDADDEGEGRTADHDEAPDAPGDRSRSVAGRERDERRRAA